MQNNLMQILWHGLSCFKIIGKEITIVTDPFDKKFGIKPPRTKADIVTCSTDECAPDQIKENPIIFDCPGEYESRGSLFRGIKSFRDNKEGQELGLNIIFTLEIENIRICHLGQIGSALTEEQEEKINEVDILLVPVGGSKTINGKQAAEIVKQTDPGIVIPMFYKIKGLKIDISSEKSFLREMGISSIQKIPKLKAAKKDIPMDETKVFLLEKV